MLGTVSTELVSCSQHSGLRTSVCLFSFYGKNSHFLKIFCLYTYFLKKLTDVVMGQVPESRVPDRVFRVFVIPEPARNPTQYPTGPVGYLAHQKWRFFRHFLAILPPK